jgi:hypothetical protein
VEAIEDIPRLYPGPFWAAYGALEGGGVKVAQTRADLAERIVAALVEAAEMTGGRSGPSARLDNTELHRVNGVLVVEFWGTATVEATCAAVYAAARVLTVG